jgi:hypothetical protein
MQANIEWQATYSRGGKHRKFWGNSNACSDEEIISAFVQQWQKVFVDMLAWYPATDWNSLVAGLDAYEGSIDFALRLDFDLKKSSPGCALHFDGLEAVTQGVFPDDEAFEEACRAETTRYVQLLMTAWEQIRDDAGVASQLPTAGLPFRIVESPDPRDPPLWDGVLTAS